MKSGGRQILALLFFVGFFGYCAWHFEIPAVRILVLQHRAQSFPVVPGKMVSGRVVSGRAAAVHGTRGRVHYHPSFVYTYEVAGRNYTGRRYRYDALPTFWNSADAEQVIKAHPVGSEIEIHYNPADPADAVLSTPLEALDIALLMIGSMVCLIPVWFLVKFGSQMISAGKAGQVAGGAKIISEAMTTRIRLPQRDPLSWSLSTIIFLCLISEIVISMNMDMRLEVAEIMALCIVLGGAAVYFWLWRKIVSGGQDLIIDEAARTLQLPLTYKRKERIQCAFSDVIGVYAARVTHRRRSGVDYTYAPTLQINGMEPQPLTDLSWERADSFASWLREKIGLAAESAVTPAEK